MEEEDNTGHASPNTGSEGCQAHVQGVRVEPHGFDAGGEASEGRRLYGAMVLSARGDARRDSMATTVQQMPPVAHVPLVLGGLRRLAVATVMARLIPPDPAPGLACGCGVEALGRAMLAGHHALSQGGAGWPREAW